MIGLCGYAKSGKDTAAQGLIDNGWTRYAFADALKVDVHTIVTRACEACGMKVPDFNQPLVKEKIRPMYIAHGAFMRSLMPDYWIKRLFAEIPEDMDNIVITDVRYLNEVKEIQSRGGTVVRIHRPGIEAANDEEKRSFFEIGVDGVNLVNIYNDKTPARLAWSLLNLAESL